MKTPKPAPNQSTQTLPKGGALSLPKGWREMRLGDVIKIIGGGTPKTSVSEYWNGQIPWITPRDLTGYTKTYISKGERNITKIGLNNSSARLMPKGSILLSSRAPIGYLAIAENEVCTNQGFKSLVVKEEIADNVFIYYWLKDNIGYLKQNGSGSTFAEISGSVIKQLNITLPPLSEQKAIAEVLSSLDDKIDLLHRQNKTLEDMAQTLFRQWFVKEADAACALHTDRESWEVLPLSDIAEVKNGFAFSSKSYIESSSNSLEVFKMGHIERGGGLRSNPKRDFVPRSEKLEKYILDKDDIVMAMTDMKDNVVILGVPAMIDKSDHYVLNQRVARIYLNSNDKLLSQYFLYIQLNDKDNIVILQRKANSGVQVNLSTQAIRSIEIIIPPLEIQKEKGQSIVDLFQKKNKNAIQILTLENLRDTLLPKLMSGKVRISPKKIGLQ